MALPKGNLQRNAHKNTLHHYFKTEKGSSTEAEWLKWDSDDTMAWLFSIGITEVEESLKVKWKEQNVRGIALPLLNLDRLEKWGFDILQAEYILFSIGKLTNNMTKERALQIYKNALIARMWEQTQK